MAIVRFHNEPNMKLVKSAVERYVQNEDVKKVLFGFIIDKSNNRQLQNDDKQDA